MKETTWNRARRTLAFTVVVFSFAMTILVGMLIAMSYVYGEPVQLYFNQLGERGIELAVMTIVIGVMPFVLLTIDEALRDAATD